MSRDLERRHIELWICWVRLIAVLFAVIEMAFLSSGYPPTSRICLRPARLPPFRASTQSG